MRFALSIAMAACAIAAQPPLPELRVEPAGGGSVMHVRNLYSQPLTAFLVELVGYPGSSFTYWHEAVGSDAIPAGAEKTFRVQNMLIGAAQDYVKMQAVLYADGSSSGVPEKVALLNTRRAAKLKATRELIARIEKAQSSATSKASLIAALKEWGESTPSIGARAAISDAIARLDQGSIDATLIDLRNVERALAKNLP